MSIIDKIIMTSGSIENFLIQGLYVHVVQALLRIIIFLILKVSILTCIKSTSVSFL